MFINSIVQTFFMPNCDEFSELIRTGGLDFALLKPIDTQFLISLRKIEWSALANFVAGARAARREPVAPDDAGGHPLELSPLMIVLYPFYVLCGVAILYSLMIGLAATSIWLGRNSRSTTSGFTSRISRATRWRFTAAATARRCGWPSRSSIPVLIVVNVPAQIIGARHRPDGQRSGRWRSSPSSRLPAACSFRGGCLSRHCGATGVRLRSERQAFMPAIVYSDTFLRQARNSCPTYAFASPRPRPSLRLARAGSLSPLVANVRSPANAGG